MDSQKNAVTKSFRQIQGKRTRTVPEPKNQVILHDGLTVQERTTQLRGPIENGID